ncbi:MAG: lipoyl(octanoyl) transferase LipB [Actinobacteria bacterium]|nr:lipoyl(octanoyl) transferase LipB [Actinomycetota bacterium]
MKPCLVVNCDIKRFDLVHACQRRLASLRANDLINDVLLLLEHPHTFSMGRSSKPAHLIWDDAERHRRGVALCEADRGGGVTYHGPGQLVAYPIIKLGKAPDLHRYLRNLEEALIATLGRLGVSALRVPGLTGVWVGKEKLASIGVKFARGVAWHGISINVSCDLSYFDGIIACGLSGFGQTSLATLGIRASVEDLGGILIAELGRVFCFAMDHMVINQAEPGNEIGVESV